MSAPALFDDDSNVTPIQKPSSSVVMVTPEMAERWLTHNQSNRHLRRAVVDKYARDMAQGNWELTGSIEFDPSGNLLQGQHRLHAIVKSGCTIPMFVFRGIAPRAQRVMDTPAIRKASDHLHMAKGVKNATTVTSIARQRLSSTLGTTAVSTSELEQYVDQNPEITVAASIGVKYSRSIDVAPTSVGLAAWRIADVHGWDAAEEFFYTAAEQVGLTPQDPIRAMTKFFAEARRSRKQHPLEVHLSVIIRAFNYRRAGRRVTFLRAESSNGGAVPIPAVAV